MSNNNNDHVGPRASNSDAIEWRSLPGGSPLQNPPSQPVIGSPLLQTPYLIQMERQEGFNIAAPQPMGNLPDVVKHGQIMNHPVNQVQMGNPSPQTPYVIDMTMQGTVMQQAIDTVAQPLGGVPDVGKQEKNGEADFKYTDGVIMKEPPAHHRGWSKLTQPQLVEQLTLRGVTGFKCKKKLEQIDMLTKLVKDPSLALKRSTREAALRSRSALVTEDEEKSSDWTANAAARLCNAVFDLGLREEYLSQDEILSREQLDRKERKGERFWACVDRKFNDASWFPSNAETVWYQSLAEVCILNYSNRM